MLLEFYQLGELRWNVTVEQIVSAQMAGDNSG